MNYGIFFAWVVLPVWFTAAAVLGVLSELGALGTRLQRTRSLVLLIIVGTPVPMAVHVPFLESLLFATGMALFSLVMAWEPGRIAGEAIQDPNRLRWLRGPARAIASRYRRTTSSPRDSRL